MIEIVCTDNKEKFKKQLESLINEGYEIIFSNMSMMNTNFAHRPSFYALLKR